MPRASKDFTDHEIKQIETLAGYGLTLPQIAAVMMISKQEFMTRRNERKVDRALEAGKAKAQGVIGKALYVRAKEGDIAAIRWWEMTRAKRKATQPEGDDGSSAQHIKIIIERPDED